MPAFTGELSQTPSAFEHFWEHAVGSDHAPIALQSDWQAQMQKCHADLGFRHGRFHDLLSDPMGTLVCPGDKLIYSFRLIDHYTVGRRLHWHLNRSL